MVDINYFRQQALALPGTEEQPHFDIPSFRHNKKIFATYRPKENLAMLRLPLAEQSVYCSLDGGSIFYPVPGTWGTQGATFVVLDKVKKTIFKEALKVAYNDITKKK